MKMVAIKDMEEIPKSCCDEDKVCPLFNEEIGTCNGVEEFIMADTTMRRFPNCPLVEIEERKAGEWVDIHDREEWYGDQFKCSVCGWVTLDNGSYCPNCGAEMGGNGNERQETNND